MTVAVDELPTASAAFTTNALVPMDDVSIDVPFVTVPVHDPGPAPASAHAYAAATDWLSAYAAPLTGVVIEMKGPFRSILLPGIGPTVVQLPAASQTTRLSVLAFAVSTPGSLHLTRKKEPSPALG